MTPPFRVLMAADTLGGVWSFTFDLLSGLRDSGIDVLLAAMGGPVSPAGRRALSDLPHVRLVEADFPLEWMNNPWPGVDAAGRWLLQLAGEFEAKVIHLNDYSHGALPWEAPVLITAHSCVFSWWEATKGCLPPAAYEEYHRRVRAGLRGAAVITAPSWTMLTEIERHYCQVGESFVIHNACRANATAVRTKRSVILSAGRVWDEAKNLALLERIAQRLDWPVHVAGNTEHPCGGKSQQFRDAQTLGRLTREAFREELASAAIFASPALYEPFGLAVLEAAQAGCALVLSDIPSFRELWDGAAVFCNPHDDSAWIAELNRLSASPEVRRRLSALASRRAAEFSIDTMTQSYFKIYRRLAREAALFGKAAA